MEPKGKGILVLRDDNKVGFMKKKLLGGYEQEPNHWYTISSIVNLKEYSDGIDVGVYFGATEERPAEVTTFFYELKGDPSSSHALYGMSRLQCIRFSVGKSLPCARASLT